MKKKFTMLLASLFLAMGTAWAQWSNRPIESVSSTAATELVDGYYVIYNNGRGTFLNAEASLGQAKVTWPTSASYTGTAALNSDEDLTNASGTKNKNAYVFYANVEGTTVSLQNGYGNYVPALTSDGNFNYVSDESFWSFAFKTDANSSYVFLSNSESGKGLDCNGYGADSHTYSTAAGWNADGSQSVSGNQSWTFYPVVFKSDVTLVDLVINYTFGGNQVKTETVQGLAGSEYTIPALDFTSVASCAIDDAAATEGATIFVPDANATVTVELEANLPFVVSTDYNSATWYVVQNRTTKYMSKTNDGVKVSNDTPNTEDALWAFMGDPFNGITVLNKAAGANFTLANDNGIKMKDGEAFVWNIYKGNGGFMLREGTTGNNYIHNVGGGNGLGYWNDAATTTDNGSAFVVTSEAEMISLATTAMGLASKLDTYAEASYYTYPNAAVAEAKATLQDVATPTDFLTALTAKAKAEAAQNILDASSKGTTAPAIGDFIVLKNKAKNEYMTTMESGDEVHRTSDKNNPKALWKVVAGGENKVKLYNVASEKYLGELSQSTKVLMVEEANAAQFTFSNVTDVYAAFTSGGGTYTYAHMDGWYDRVVGWEAPASTDASLWLVSNVSPLSITYLLNGETVSTSTEVVEYGTVYTVTSPIDFTIPVACKKGEEALEAVDGIFSFEVKEATNLTVELVESLPFTKTVLNEDGSFPENTAWYVVKQHSNPQETRVWKYDAESGVTTEATTTYTDNHLWCFAGSKDDLKIYNKAAGSDVSLSNTDPASMVAVAGNTAEWKMVKSDNEYSFAGKNPFCLQNGDNPSYLNRQGDGLTYWNSKDYGSTIMVIAQSAIELEALVNRLNGTIDAMIENAGIGIGYYESADDVAKLKESIEKAQALLESNSKKNEDYVAAIAELEELEAKAAEIALPEEGKYYRIGYDFGSEGGVRYMESVNSDVKGLNMTPAVDGLSTIFYYIDKKLQSLETKKYLKEEGNTRGLHDEGGAITFSAGDVLGKIKVAAPAYLHANTNGENCFVDHCSGDNGDNQHNFVIKELSVDDLNEAYLQGSTYITALPTENSNHPLTIAPSTSAWAVDNEGTALTSIARLGLAADVLDPKQQFAIITVDGSSYLYSIHAKRFVKKNNTFGAQGDAIQLNDASSVGGLENNDKRRQFQFVGEKLYFNVDGYYNMAINWWGTLDRGNACLIVSYNQLTFDLEEALDIFNNGADITVTYKVGDKQVSTTTYKEKGETYSFSNPYAFTTVTSCKKDGVDLVAAEGTYSFEITGDANIVVELQDNIPFETTTIVNDAFAEGTTWYLLRQKDAKNYWSHNQENNEIKVGGEYNIYNDLWCFIGNPLEGFKIYNKAAGPSYSLDNSSPAKLVENCTAVWEVHESTFAFNVEDIRFALSRPGKTGYNQYANLQSNTLMGWSLDAGSTTNAMPVADKYAEIIAAWEKLLTLEKNIVGGLRITEGYQDLINTYKTSPTQINEDAVNDFITENQLELQNGKCYMLVSAYEGFYNKQGVEKAIYSYATDLRWGTRDNSNKAYYWQAVQVDDDLRFKNTNDNTYMALKSTTSTSESIGENGDPITSTVVSTDIVMWDGTSTESGVTYNAKVELLSTGVLTQWNIKLATGNLHANNHSNGDGNNSDIIHYGSGANGASSWRLIEVEHPDLAIAKINLQARIDELNPMTEYAGTDPGYYKVEEIAKLATALAVAEEKMMGGSSDPVEYINALEALNAAVVGVDFELVPVTAGLYRIVSASTEFKEEKCITLYAQDGYYYNHSNPGWSTSNLNDPKQYWVLETADNGKFYLKGVDGNYITTATSMSEIATAATFTNIGKTQFNITLGDDAKPLHTNGWNWQNTTEASLTTWDGGVGSCSAWKLVKVLTEPEFTFNLTVGSVGYATLILGFDAEIPEGVTCYTAEVNADENVANLSAITGGVLPANTPVIVKAEAETYTFVSTDKVTTTPKANELKGTLYPKIITPDANTTCYVLSKPAKKPDEETDPAIGFYPIKLTRDKDGKNGDTSFQNGANKVYLPVKTAGGQAPALMFRFGTTEVEDIVADKETEPMIYDLMGRRVEKMVEGIYIVNGKKVVIK